MDKIKLVDIYGNPVFSPCMCCGMTYSPEISEKGVWSGGKGIRVVAGIRPDKLPKNGKYEVHHVNTKQGDLTVVIKVKE